MKALCLGSLLPRRVPLLGVEVFSRAAQCDFSHAACAPPGVQGCSKLVPVFPARGVCRNVFGRPWLPSYGPAGVQGVWRLPATPW
eukprot:9476051-Pyramimonas_sp.AAC.1